MWFYRRAPLRYQSSLMQRTAGTCIVPQTIFIDTSSSCDQMNTSLTLFLVATNVGAVPVACSLHQGQSEKMYTTPFSQVKQLWETDANLAIGNFMTDESAPLKNALRSV